MNNHITKKLSELPIQQFLQQLSLNDLLWSYDAISFYPTAMIDDKSVYPRIATGYSCTKKMNDELVENFNIQTFTQGSAILKLKSKKSIHSTSPC